MIEALGNGLLDVGSMITSKITVDRVVEDGFLALQNNKDGNVKILIDTRA